MLTATWLTLMLLAKGKAVKKTCKTLIYQYRIDSLVIKYCNSSFLRSNFMIRAGLNILGALEIIVFGDE